MQNYDERIMLIAFTHLGAMILVLILFIFRNSLIRRYYRLYPEQVGRPVSMSVD
jgi:hypothetical protein